MITSKIPDSIDELKDGDEYQIQFPMSDYWSTPKVFRTSNCDCDKSNLERLINCQRLRIIVHEEKD